MSNLLSLAFTIAKISVFIWTDRDADRRTDEHGSIDSTSDSEQEYMDPTKSATPPSACYKHLQFDHFQWWKGIQSDREVSDNSLYNARRIYILEVVF